MTGRENSIAEIPLREGAAAIYIERPTIVYVRVTGICAFGDSMEAQVTVIPSPGMIEGDVSSFKISAIWDVLSNVRGQWHAPSVARSAYFDQEDVRTGLEIAARAAEQGRPVTLQEMRRALEDNIYKRMFGPRD